MLCGLEDFNLPNLEEKILRFWRENGIFQRILKKRRAGRSKKFVFFEGPPTANGKPGIHHVLARSFKDVVLRYKTMRGFFVPRRAGWDTHGLPVELQVEKALGLKSKKEIEAFGVEEFNKKCKESVWQYKDDWEKLTDRMGYWLDMKDPYITYDNEYIERVWGILKKIWDRGLIYKSHRVVPWCTRCGTVLSSHELAQGYKKVTDTAVVVKFKLRFEPDEVRGRFSSDQIFILSWTTTPWTLPGNVALAINPNFDYVVVQSLRHGPPTQYYILEKSRLEALKNLVPDLDYSHEPERISVKELLGRSYEPLFDVKNLQKTEKLYKIYAADFVNTADGTGVVHTAVMYGEDDYDLGTKEGLPKEHTVSEEGRFEEKVPGLSGMYAKSQTAEDKIISILKEKGLLLKTEQYEHDYPHCWRCDTALLYYARDSWFIRMSGMRKELLKENEKISWIPDHVKNGRFGEWLREAKDWAISRNRYWGTPLPFWICGGCGDTKIFENREELSKGVLGPGGNVYILVRHGEAVNNREKVVSAIFENNDRFPLTELGRKTVADVTAKMIKKMKPNIVISSDFKRTMESANIIGENLGLEVVIDKRLREISIPNYDGKPVHEYAENFISDSERFIKKPLNGGETLRELSKRAFSFIRETEGKYKKKKIVVVSHEHTLWMLETVLRGWGEEEAVRAMTRSGGEFIANGEAREVGYLRVPRSEFGICDLHKPFIDDLKFSCGRCGEKMERVPEVLDVWFDSGAMPWASQDIKEASYPADYICEGIDQTRGWFYTLLAEGVLLNKGRPYKNVMSLGHILDKNGKKMSKSKGNIIDPWEMIQKYGADAVRWYFFTVNPPGEPKRFDEKDIQKVSRDFFSLLHNCFVFYKTYADEKAGFDGDLILNNVLDKWIVARLQETISGATRNFDDYEVGRAARMIEDFVGDLSRWYIRRSRRRLQKPESQRDYKEASGVLHRVLRDVSLLLAPFAPFFAEALFRDLQSNGFSVHEELWPEFRKKYFDKNIIQGMKDVRELAAEGLAKRSEAGIKVRQPLAGFTVPVGRMQNREEFLEILKDEINVKRVVFSEAEGLALDIAISEDLREEGVVREFVRMVQGLRQDGDFMPKDLIRLVFWSDEDLLSTIEKNKELIKKEVNAKDLIFKKEDNVKAQLQSKLNGGDIWVGITKV